MKIKQYNSLKEVIEDLEGPFVIVFYAKDGTPQYYVGQKVNRPLSILRRSKLRHMFKLALKTADYAYASLLKKEKVNNGN